MVALQSFSVVIFLSTFPSGRTDASRSRALFPINDSPDVNEGIPYSSRSASKSDYIISPKLTHPVSDSRLDSGRNPKIPLSLCCPAGEARNQGSCVADNATTEIVPRINIRVNDYVDRREVSEQNFDLLFRDPCDYDWMIPSTLDNFELENGFVRDADFGAESRYDVEHYCLYRRPESNMYSARVCRPFTKKSIWNIFCATIIIFIMLAVFIVYSIIPEHRNLHGMIFRSYIGTYALTAAGVLVMQFTTESRTNVYLYSFSDITVRYCAGACAGWLNAMSFNVWRSFRSLRPVDFHAKERDKRKFIVYAIYSWVDPAVALMILLVPIYYLPSLSNEELGYKIRLWYCVEVITAAYVSNTILYIWTALAIRNHKRATAHLVNGVNRHNEIDEQWFNLYVKLFVLTGGHIAMWIIILIWPTSTTTHILATLELIQAIVIFVIFVWKENIRQSVRQRILTSLTRLRTILS